MFSKEPARSDATVTSLAEWRARDAAKLLEYLQARLKANDLRGLVVQSLDRRGKERVHMTGVYKADPAKALGAALSLSVRMTAAQEDDTDDED